jgi:hypothetical protein
MPAEPRKCPACACMSVPVNCRFNCANCDLSAPLFVLDKMEGALLTLGCVEETFGALVATLGYKGEAGDIDALIRHIEEMRSPTGVLAEAEKLLRPRGRKGRRVTTLRWEKHGPVLELADVHVDEDDEVRGDTLAEAFAHAKLTGGCDG